MQKRVILRESPEDFPPFTITDEATLALWNAGWTPPANQAIDIVVGDTILIIPKRNYISEAAIPTAHQLEMAILQRLASRLDLEELTKTSPNGLENGAAIVLAAGDAAEAILDLMGGTA